MHLAHMSVYIIVFPKSMAQKPRNNSQWQVVKHAQGNKDTGTQGHIILCLLFLRNFTRQASFFFCCCCCCCSTIFAGSAVTIVIVVALIFLPCYFCVDFSFGRSHNFRCQLCVLCSVRIAFRFATFLIFAACSWTKKLLLPLPSHCHFHPLFSLPSLSNYIHTYSPIISLYCALPIGFPWRWTELAWHTRRMRVISALHCQNYLLFLLLILLPAIWQPNILTMLHRTFSIYRVEYLL